MVGGRKWLWLALFALSARWVFRPGASSSILESPTTQRHGASRFVEMTHARPQAIRPPQKRAPEPPKPAVREPAVEAGLPEVADEGEMPVVILPSEMDPPDPEEEKRINQILLAHPLPEDEDDDDSSSV